MGTRKNNKCAENTDVVPVGKSYFCVCGGDDDYKRYRSLGLGKNVYFILSLKRTWGFSMGQFFFIIIVMRLPYLADPVTTLNCHQPQMMMLHTLNDIINLNVECGVKNQPESDSILCPVVYKYVVVLSLCIHYVMYTWRQTHTGDI